MPSKRRQHQRPLLFLHFLLPCALGVSLADFQPIQSDNKACLNAYNGQIPECTRADFLDGAACSDECVESLKKAQDPVMSSCKGISGPGESLLGQILQGEMVYKLCPNTAAASTTSDAAVSTTDTASSTTDAPDPAASSTDPPSKASSSAAESTTTDAASSSTTSSTIDTAPSPFPNPNAPSSSSEFTFTRLNPSATSTANSINDNGGGGSPFDLPSGASSHLHPRATMLIAAAIAVFVRWAL